MQYRYFPFLLCLQVVVMLSSLSLVHRLITIGNLTFSMASFIFPLTFLISNIVAEVYSYYESKQVLWMGLFAQVPFSLLCALAQVLPMPPNYSDMAFDVVFGDLLRISAASLIAAYIGISINILVFSKLRRHFHQLRFFVRSIIASVTGEFLFTVLALPLMFLGNIPLSALLWCVVISVLVKLIYCLILSPPCTLIVHYLNRHERGIPHPGKYDHFTYNPFHLTGYA